MHILFFNPQGNFDKTDSYMTEHPDFGGQLVYVCKRNRDGHGRSRTQSRYRDPSDY